MTEIFHEATRGQLGSLIEHRPHAVILSGPHGIGLTGAAQRIAHELKAAPYIVLPEKNEKVDIENGVISVESIRRLYNVTKTIETRQRVIIIDYAERMGVQAQNAFLKLLEEPGAHTMFILLSHEPGKLLPTIRSRAQLTELRPITRAQSEAVLDAEGVKDARKRAQLLFVADGLPAELKRLATDDTYFDQRAGVIRDARTFLQGTQYEKFIVIQKYQNDRSGAILLLKDAMNLLRQTWHKTPMQSLLDQLAQLMTTYERLEANGNIRLQLADGVV